MNNSKPLPSFGLALAPIAVMFALLAIGYGVLGLRIGSSATHFRDFHGMYCLEDGLQLG